MVNKSTKYYEVNPLSEMLHDGFILPFSAWRWALSFLFAVILVMSIGFIVLISWHLYRGLENTRFPLPGSSQFFQEQVVQEQVLQEQNWHGRGKETESKEIEEKSELILKKQELELFYKKFIFMNLCVIVSAFGLFFIMLQFLYRNKNHLGHYQEQLLIENAHFDHQIQDHIARLEQACHHSVKERKRVELLLQDTSHRIGNSLATVSALLGLQLQRSTNTEVREALASARNRIQAISTAHRRLRLGEDLETASACEFLTAVVSDIQTGIAADLQDRIQFKTCFEDWHLASRDVTTLGIILGELLTNAVKHAFPQDEQGTILVYFGKAKGRYLQLIVEDDGVGFSEESIEEGEKQTIVSQGLGKIVVLQLCLQFGANPCFKNGDTKGAKVIIPLPNLVAYKIKKNTSTKQNRKTKPHKTK